MEWRTEMGRSLRVWSWHGKLVFLGDAGDVRQQEIFALGQFKYIV